MKLLVALTALLVIASCLVCLTNAQGRLPPSKDAARRHEKMRGFLEWLTKEGFPSTPISWNNEEGLLFAQRDISATEPVFSAPTKFLFSIDKLRNKDHPLHICLAADSGMSAPSCMTLFLLYEFYNPNTWWRPYFDILPLDYSNLPLFWAEEDIAALQALAPSMRAIVQDERALHEATYNEAMKFMEAHPELFPKPFTPLMWQWAMLTFKTRGFLMRTPTPIHPGAEGDALESQGVANFLAPVADLFNHGAATREELLATEFTWSGEGENMHFQIFTHRNHTNGQEIMISYGPNWNTGLLLAKYGFVPRGGRYANDWLDTTIPIVFPEDPNKAEKLEWIQELKPWPGAWRFETMIFMQTGVPMGTIAALRISELIPEQWENLRNQNVTAKQFLDPRFVTLENEWAVLSRISRTCGDMLGAFETSPEQDDALLLKKHVEGEPEPRMNTVMAIAYRKYVKDMINNARLSVRQRWLSLIEPSN